MQIMLLIAWLLQGAQLVWAFSATPVYFGFATALSLSVWLAVAIYLIEKRIYPDLQLPNILLPASLVAILLCWVFPGWAFDASVSLWLPLHLLFGVSSYALFAVAVLHAWRMSRQEQYLRHITQANSESTTRPVLPLMTQERILFNLLIAGFILLSMTLIVGLGFREALYGPHHLWRWEHKTVFAMLSWLVFAVLLWGHFVLGWRGRRALRWIYAGAAFLLLSYVGSRFVLEVILHKGL